MFSKTIEPTGNTLHVDSSCKKSRAIDRDSRHGQMWYRITICFPINLVVFSRDLQ